MVIYNSAFLKEQTGKFFTKNREIGKLRVQEKTECPLYNIFRRP